jgi:ferredoxin
VLEGGKLKGMNFDVIEYALDAKGAITAEKIVGEEFIEADDVILAIGQENAFPWIERDIGLAFDEWGMPVVDKATFQSTRAEVFFGGDAAFGPKNIIWAVAHGHDAAISIDKHCHGEDISVRPPPMVNLLSQKMGIHEWSYDNQVAPDARFKVPLKDLTIALKDIRQEVELGFDVGLAWKEAQRCLNCDVQTVFAPKLCIECDACVDICPVDCITFTANGEEGELRARLNAPSPRVDQPLYVSTELKTARVMVKDEDVCLHCGLCAERCPTGAWDMQKFLLETAEAGPRCRSSGARKAAA